MKTPRLSLALLSLVCVSLRGQTPPPVSVPGATATQPAESGPRRTAEELEQLLGPIALYPDALIALILPASTLPAEIVLAARHVRGNPNDRSQIEHRAWDESVKALTHYADVLKWMDENLDWTRQVGEAFVQQPAEVMETIQRLRAKARAAGTLIDTPQQQILAEPDVIRIVPAQRDVIYVPHYEPEVVFVDRPVYYSSSFVTFGVGVPVGSWLAFDCDWRRRSIWHGDRHRRWTSHDWRQPLVPIVHTHTPVHRPPVHVHTHSRHVPVRQWCPPPQAVRPSFSVAYHGRHSVARPTPITSLGGRSHTHHSASNYGPRPAPTHRATPAAPPYSVRQANVQSLPPVNPLPQTFANDRQREYPGPRPAGSSSRGNSHSFARQPSAVSPAVVAAPAATAPVTHGHGTTQVVTSPTHRRPGGGDSNHSRDSRVRHVRPSHVSTPAALPRVPALPMAPQHAAIMPSGPNAPARSYSHSQQTRARSLPQPAVVPALPIARAAAPAVAPAPAPAATPQAATPATENRAHPSGRRGGRPDTNRHEH